VTSRVVTVPVSEHRDASYDVVVGRGVLAELPGLLARLCPARGYAVIADHRVAELYGGGVLAAIEGAGLRAQLFTFPAGEWNKSRETWAQLSDALLAARLGRDGAIVALGGGVAGDLAGFVAATYLRGVAYVQVPTTLLAMIDAAIGGKTGVDVPAGKNLVGAFHQPRFVLADTALLASLPRVHLAAGAAEAIKHGLIADAGYAAGLGDDATRVLAREPEALDRAVARSVAIKAAVVARDTREAGVRQILNFGHTIGHAVESGTGYELLHGEAVAIGIAVEARLAERLGVAGPGLARCATDLLARYGLPTTLPAGLTDETLLAAMESDKKNRRGALRFALPAEPGRMAQSADGEWTVEASGDVLMATLEECR